MSIEYVDVSRQEVRDARTDMIGRIEGQGLLYPVTVIDDIPAYDGAVSYPAILRAVQNKLDSLREMA